MPHRVITVLCLLTFSQSAFAAPRPELPSKSPRKETQREIPSQPAVPPSLGVRIPKQTSPCQRSFVYDGKMLNCDSNIRQDGEGLRQIFSQTPTALTELEIYQQNRRTIRRAAYLGTAGLVLGLLGSIIGSQMTNADGTSISLTGISIRNTLLFSGIALAGGSFIYGFSLMRANENHLIRATQHHNVAHPDKPIELQFNTGIVF